ncbi:MAG: HU family DNA-binding protein [Planctomycetota bacterium]
MRLLDACSKSCVDSRLDVVHTRSTGPSAPEQQHQIGATTTMGTVTKKDLIDRIADGTGQKRVTVKKTIQSFLDQVIVELGRGNRLEFRDFGVFEIRERKARTAQNPKTLEPVDVPAKKVVKFKVGRLMQQSLDEDEHAQASGVERSSQE